MTQRDVESPMKMRSRCLQLGGEKREHHPGLLRVRGTVARREEPEGTEEAQNLLRGNPAIGKDVLGVYDTKTNEFAENPMHAHVERRGWRIKLLPGPC